MKLGDKYILDKKGNPVVENDLMKWAEWFERSRNERRVARDEKNGSTVSTVFLGLDHSFGDDSVELFETCVFRKDGESDVEARYATREEALAGHKKILESL